MHLVAETAPGGLVVRELGGQNHLAHLLVVAVHLLVVPQFNEVVAEGMCGHYLLAILDYGIEVGAHIVAVPGTVVLRGTEQMGLGQEVGSGILVDAARG